MATHNFLDILLYERERFVCDFNHVSTSRCVRRCSKCEAILCLRKRLHLQLLKYTEHLTVVFCCCCCCFSSTQLPYQAEKKWCQSLTPDGKEFQSYRSRLVKWLTLENSERASYEAKALSLCSSSFAMHFEALKQY